MDFRKDEIKVEGDVTEDEAEDLVTFECPGCGHRDVFHPEMAAPEGAAIFCAECGLDFGSWDEFRARLFKGAAMLASALSRRPGAPTG